MYFTRFVIRNFKGIEEVRLDLLARPRSRVHTLIGLNESGKTTLLEAINVIAYKDNLGALNLPGYVNYDPHDLIPMSQRSNFNGQITLEAGIQIEPKDKQKIAEQLQQDHGILLAPMADSFVITQTYEFHSSRAVKSEPTTTWSLDIQGRLPGQDQVHPLTPEAEAKARDAIKPLLPRVVYFPNFLFDFPDKIYLEEPPTDADKHKFYRAVLQDVLDAIGERTNLEEHVLARAKSPLEPDKRSLEAVLLKMGGHISDTVFTNWDRIFSRPRAPAQAMKELVVVSGRDPSGSWYLQLRLKDGREFYSISERSLGFRWFLAYMLLTQYRGFRRAGNKNVVFLLDEPASNLHPSAQTQLLDSFDKLPDGCQVVYTTHSHHMIKPEWLEAAYVVKNAGLDYDSGQHDYSARRTLITLTKYRQFAAQHPDQKTYFQPVLDVLNYSPTKLENIPDMIMVEGKNDFYEMRYLSLLTGGTHELNFLPGTGAGSLDSIIRLYIGWARNFVVLLDSDTEGENQKMRYKDLFGGLVEGRIFTLRDLVPPLAGKSLESVFTSAEQLEIQNAAYPDADFYNKTLFNRALQEHTLTRRTSFSISQSTKTAAAGLLAALAQRLESASNLYL
jgi:energy-coupling factor transporter ATP-binding protein EcfA2